jgi:chromosome segregation ATPase
MEATETVVREEILQEVPRAMTLDDIARDMQHLTQKVDQLVAELSDVPRRGEIYTRLEIDGMVYERNSKIAAIQMELSQTNSNNEELLNRFGANIQKQLEEYRSTFDDTIRGFTDAQAAQQRNIDAVIATQRENNRQIEIILRTVEAWQPIHETNQQQFREIGQRMSNIENRQGDIEAEERDAAAERNEINRRFELVTSTTAQVKQQLTALSDALVASVGQVKSVTEYIALEKQRREIARKRWQYLKNILTSKPVIALIYPPMTALLSWIGVQVADRLQLREFVQTMIDIVEQLTSLL